MVVADACPPRFVVSVTPATVNEGSSKNSGFPAEAGPGWTADLEEDAPLRGWHWVEACGAQTKTKAEQDMAKYPKTNETRRKLCCRRVTTGRPLSHSLL